MKLNWWKTTILLALYALLTMGGSLALGLTVGFVAQMIFLPVVLLGGIGLGLLAMDRGWIDDDPKDPKVAAAFDGVRDILNREL